MERAASQYSDTTPRDPAGAQASVWADEKDYDPRFPSDVQGIFLPGTNVELIREPAGRGRYRHAVFDFDGTLSLIREGWPRIMADLMIEVLSETPSCEPEAELKAGVWDFVSRTTGMQTVYQMIGLAREVERRGGAPSDPLDYKKTYVGRLMDHIGARREALRSGAAKPEEMLVPGAGAFLEDLCGRGVQLCLASGTDERYVKEEAELLGVARFFGGRTYGAVDDYKSFSKAKVIERILSENAVDGEGLLGFGDGYVEVENTKSIGGTGIGVATDEAERAGRPDPLKRARLLGVGADLIVPDFSCGRELAGYLMEA
jgi:phosphoglycolate phosphatase-like HAD superfamily hydrolase